MAQFTTIFRSMLNEFTLGHMFQRAGYETGYAGKWHLDGKNDPTWPDWIPEERSFGFADHKWMFNQGHWKRIEERPEGWPNNRSVATKVETTSVTATTMFPCNRMDAQMKVTQLQRRGVL
jgi:arylsulfatase A-like enzyme